MEDKEVVIQEKLGDPGPAAVFIFSAWTWFFLFVYIGVFDPVTTALPLGLFLLVCTPEFLYTGMTLIKKGDTISGVVYLIFSAAFAGGGGIENLLAWYSTCTGVVIDMTIFNVLFIISAIVLIPVVITMTHGPKVPLIVFATAVPELALVGLVGLGAPVFFLYILIACFVIVGCGSLYMACACLANAGGKHWPL